MLINNKSLIKTINKLNLTDDEREKFNKISEDDKGNFIYNGKPVIGGATEAQANQISTNKTNIATLKELVGDSSSGLVKAVTDNASQLDNKASKQEVDVERERITNLATLQQGSTTGDAELIDGRIGDDAKVYNNIGEAIRGQFRTIKNDLYNVFDGDTIITGYIKKSDMVISGVDTVDDKFTKALLETQSGSNLGVSIIEVNPNEIYKISGDTFYGMYNALGVIFSDTLWEDGFTTSNRINIISGNYDYYCGITLNAWKHFSDYMVVVPAGAKYMYVRGNETIKKAGQQLVSKIPIKNSQLVNDSSFVSDKYKYFKDFTVNISIGIVSNELYRLKNSSKGIKWNLTENTTGEIKFSDLGITCKETDRVGMWVYLSKAITDRHTTRSDGNSIEGAFSVKFNGGEFDSGIIYPGYKYHNGWNYIEFNPSLTEIRDIIITFTRVYGDYELIFDSIELNNKKRTKIMLSFDNNQSNLYTDVYPLLKDRGFVGTYALPTNVLDDVGTTGITLSNHRELMANGWDYAYYGSGSNRPSWTSSVDDWVTFFTNWRKTYETIGIGMPIAYFSPENRSDKTLIEAEKKAGFKMNRSMIAIDSNIIDNWDKDTFEMTCIGVFTKEGSSPSKALIDKVIDEGKHLCIFAHQVLDTTSDTESVNVSKAVYTEVLDYLKSKVDNNMCDVITFREFYQMHEPIDYNEFMATRRNVEMNYLLNK